MPPKDEAVCRHISQHMASDFLLVGQMISRLLSFSLYAPDY